MSYNFKVHLVRISALLLAAGLVGLVPAAGGQTTGEHGASLLIFPKVVAGGSGDTVLQVTNLLESRVDVFCSYVHGTTWDATSFSLTLLPEQPLHWVASRGRTATGEEDPNDIPAAPAEFEGEMICVEVDGTGAPGAGNRLVGRATVTALADGDAFAYAAVGVPSSGFNDGDDTLCLGGDVSDVCLFGPEYNACPAGWRLTHPSDGAPDAQLGAGATQHTRLVVVPCSQNVRDAEPATVTMTIAVTNEFEQRFTSSNIVTCWTDVGMSELSSSFTFAVLGTAAAATSLRPAEPSGAFVVLAERERRAAGGAVVARDALIPQQEGAAATADILILPMEQP